jgi:ribosome maturation factor RimP
VQPLSGTTEISEILPGSVVAVGTSTGSTNDVTAAVRSLVAHALESNPEFGDVFVVDLVVRGHKGNRVIEIYVDGDESLSIERIARVGRFADALLEGNEDVTEGACRLEVSSPGPKRSLLLPRQYAKHIGRKVDLRRAPENGGRVTGILRAVGDAEIELEVSSERVVVSLNQILEGKVALPW